MTKSSVSNYLQHESNTLGTLLVRLNKLKTWNSWLRNALKEEPLLTQHCQIVGLDGTSLIVIADNSHWVTRFRFFIPQLLTQLRQYPDFKNIRAICCKVMPLHHRAYKKTKRQPLIISEKTAEIMQDTAKKVKDEKLKTILQRLASRVMSED